MTSPAEVFTGFTPRIFQQELRNNLRRFNVIVTHRRFGKTIFLVNHMIAEAIQNKNPMPRYAYIAPTYQMGKRIVWDFLKKYTQTIPAVTYNEAELRVDFGFNQARITVLSAENYQSLKGLYFDGVCLDEHAQFSPSVWTEAIRPTLVDRKGWAIFASTPKGQNQFYELWEYAKNGKEGKLDPDWFQAVYPVSLTKLVDADELESLRKNMSEEEYAQEFECDFTAGLSHAYFSKELKRAEAEGRIRDVPYDPVIPVDTYWDLGVNDSTVVWYVQSTRLDHRIIDCDEFSGVGLNTVIPKIKQKLYNFDEFVLPHDAAVRDLATGKARRQMFYDFGIRRTRIVPRVAAGHKADCINAARVIFGKCYFDKVKCAKGLKGLANYQKKWDDKNSTYADTPLHNWASNFADAFQCFAMGVRTDAGNLGTNRLRFVDDDDDGRRNESLFKAETDYDIFERRNA